MSVTKKLLLGIGGAAVMATGLAGTANAHVVAASAGSCELYAREYAAFHAPRYGLAGWNTAYGYAYNECLTGGPSFVSVPPYPAPAYSGPFSAFGQLLAAPVVAAGNIAGAAVHAGASVAGAVLSAPAAIASGVASAVAPAVWAEPVVTPTAATPVTVTKNYRGTYETAPVVVAAEVTSTAALAVPDLTAVPAQFSPEWHAYCAAKYRSYSPDTGMYVAYSGQHLMCN